MCSTSEILNDSKEPRRRRFDKNIFDYANRDYKNPDFTNTKILDIFIFWIELISLTVISSIKTNWKLKLGGYFSFFFHNLEVP